VSYIYIQGELAIEHGSVPKIEVLRPSMD
jgi:hypothetical protein